MKGHYHPITIITDRLVEYFKGLDFEVITGPEAETEENNFDLLNFPKNHPARDMQDTFYLENGLLLRTHTSPIQLRAMQTRKPPVRLVAPGRVFRNEATDSTHETNFYQLECLVIDKDTNIKQLHATLKGMFDYLLNDDIDILFKPAYFPFVKPGLEVSIKFRGKWLEMLGAGMVHPNVLKNMNVGEEYQGFAFGVGIERLASLVYNVNDVRLNMHSDYRYNAQFK